MSYNSRPSRIHTSGDVEDPYMGHCWRDDDGDVYATVRFGYAGFTFYNPGTARAVAAACTAAAEAMEKLEAEDVVRTAACARCKERPVDRPGATRPDGQPSDRATYCSPCIERCHEATDFAHVCVICATPEEARALGYTNPVRDVEAAEAMEKLEAEGQ